MDTLEIVRVLGLATVQDRGRPGRLFEGVPAGGPFVPELWARANLAAQRDSADAALRVDRGMAASAFTAKIRRWAVNRDMARASSTMAAREVSDKSSCSISAGQAATNAALQRLRL